MHQSSNGKRRMYISEILGVIVDEINCKRMHKIRRKK